MQFKKHTLDPLRLAILTIIFTGTQSTAYAENAWNCKEVNNQWDCNSPLPDTGIYSEETSQENLAPEPNNAPTLNERASLNTTDSRQVSINPSASNTEQENVYKQESEHLKVETKSPLLPLDKSEETTTKIEPISPAPSDAPDLTSSVRKDESLALLNEQNQHVPNSVEQTTIDYKTLDWYPYTRSSNNNNICKGRYISPQIGEIDDDTSPSLQTVFVSADQSNSELGKAAILNGNVDIKQGGRSLHSPLAKLNQETGAFSLEEGVTYRQTGLLISGQTANGNINEEEISLSRAKYVLHQQSIRGDAKKITRKTQEILEIDEGSVTFCPPGDETWKISASNIKLDTASGFGRAKNAKLSLFGSTFLYFPVFYFPIDDRRHSGFLYPSFKFSNSETKITIPYYFNIASNIDDTLTATLFSKSGLLLENELRYLNKNSINRLSTGFMKEDKNNTGNRWLIGANHNGHYGRFNTVIDYTEVSDDDYFSDLGTSLDVDEGDNDHLNQTAKVTYNADTWQSSLLVQKYQTIDSTKTKPYQRLPEFRISGSPADNIENLSFNYRAVFTRFDRDQTGLSGTDLTVGDRLIINPSINGDFRTTWGYIKPAVKLWHANYSLSDQPSTIDNKQVVTVPVFELDSGLYFDRDFSFQEKAYTQTLEPRLYALYAPHVDQTKLPDFDTSELTFTYNSLFRDNRFSGDDRFGDAKQISLGLTSRAISEQGREIVSASIGHAFYFNDRIVRVDPSDDPIKDDTSDFATSIAWRPNSRVRALFDAAFDADSLDNSEMTLDLKYEEDPNHVIGLRHRFTRDTRKQTTLSYLWPLTSQWSSLGLIQYDWQNNNTLDFATGLEYQNCCWSTRLIFRNELTSTNQRDNSVALQFSFKGLGGVGKNPAKELKDKIKGYQKREYYNANN
jgi:LPS-assembly protein